MAQNFRRVQVLLFDTQDQRLDAIAAELARRTGASSPNRSDAIRLMIESFDIEEWARRQSKSEKCAA